jgi:Protein of unknown function (DUF3592)
MHPIELIRGFVEDLWRLPVLFKLFFLYAAGAAVWQWNKKKKQAAMLAASETWPVYRARVVWAQVTDRKSEGENGSSYWEGVLTYSYTVPGHEIEVGEYRKRFYDEDEANAWARSLRDTSVDVRVDPVDTKRSVWKETASTVHLSQTSPALDSAPIEAEGWGIREVAAIVVLLAAIAGALVAAWIQISYLHGDRVIPEGGHVFFAMHIGAMICGIASFGLFPKSGRILQTSFWQSITENSFASLVVKCIGFYATAIFFYGWVHTAADDDKQNSFGPLMFSAIWLSFYVSSALVCWRALQGAETNSLSSPNG